MRKTKTFGCSHCKSRHDFGPNGEMRCPLVEGEATIWNTDLDRSSAESEEDFPPPAVDDSASEDPRPPFVL